ncbi:mechanosensitive ion channel family protein [Microcystis aeruginosa]|uniref:mechanosensitive ion channel family protein n=1 Tax=Microcystis aeruginosa TaxID=1126 RepID=UPI0012DA4240
MTQNLEEPDLAISFGAKLIGAILLWFIGKWLINLAVNLLKTSLAKGNVDPTIIGNFGSETPPFYGGFAVKYEHRLRNMC